MGSISVGFRIKTFNTFTKRVKMEETKRVEEILDNFFQDNLVLNIDNQSYIYSYEKLELPNGSFKYVIVRIS